MKRTTATNSASGKHADRVAGVSPGTLDVAEDRNNLQEETCNVIEGAGFTLDGTDQRQLRRSIIAYSHSIGEIIESEIPLTPIPVSASNSTANPTYPDYLPIIDRSTDKDVTSAQAPDLVTAYRAVKMNVKGTDTFTGTVSGSVVTFSASTPVDAMLALIAADALVRGWLNGGQPATFAVDFSTTTTRRTITVAGTEYEIVGLSTASRTITVSGSPATGSQTCYFYTYRVAGYTDRVRLLKLSGFVGVAAGDADGEVVEGWQKMDRFEPHAHTTAYSHGTSGSAGLLDSVTASSSGVLTTSTPIGDGTNLLRTGKTTDPRTHGRRVYTWARRLLAVA